MSEKNDDTEKLLRLMGAEQLGAKIARQMFEETDKPAEAILALMYAAVLCKENSYVELSLDSALTAGVQLHGCVQSFAKKAANE